MDVVKVEKKGDTVPVTIKSSHQLYPEPIQKVMDQYEPLIKEQQKKIK